MAPFWKEIGLFPKHQASISKKIAPPLWCNWARGRPRWGDWRYTWHWFCEMYAYHGNPGLGYHVPQLLAEKEGIIPVSSIGSVRFADWHIPQSYWWLSLYYAPKHGQIMLGMWLVSTGFLNTSSVTTLHVHLKYPTVYDRYSVWEIVFGEIYHIATWSVLCPLFLFYHFCAGREDVGGGTRSREVSF